MSPEQVNEILQMCEASAGEGGFRDLPPKTTLNLYVAKNGVGLTVGSIEALAIKGLAVHARTTKGELYVVSLEDVFAAEVEGKAQSKTVRRAGFA